MEHEQVQNLINEFKELVETDKIRAAKNLYDDAFIFIGKGVSLSRFYSEAVAIAKANDFELPIKIETNETPFNAEQNEIEYEDAMTAQAKKWTVERAELVAANAMIDSLRTGLAAANAKVEFLHAELKKAHDINFNLIETVAQLSEKLPEEDELFDEDPAMY